MRSGSAREMSGMWMSPVWVLIEPSGITTGPLSHTVTLRSGSMSSNTAIWFAPTTVILRILCGSSHDRCRWPIWPETNLMYPKRRPRRPAARSLAARPDLDRLAFEQVQHHRDVVHAEAPEGVLVRPDHAQVDPVAVHVVHVAEVARIDQLAQLVHPGVEPQQVADHQHRGRCPRRGRAARGPPRPSRSSAFRPSRACRRGLPAGRARSESAPGWRARRRQVGIGQEFVVAVVKRASG